MKSKKYIRAATCAGILLGLAGQANAGGSAMYDQQLADLKKLIEMQQAQLDQQAAELAALREQLQGNTESLADKADKAEIKEMAKVDTMVTSRFANVNVGLYGQVNRAALYVDDGNASDWYFVDNINSQTRLGLNATVDTTQGWQVGGRIEYGIVSNASSDVNQLKSFDATSSNFKLRWAEVFVKNDTYGKISLGKGDSASNNSTEVDLSGTAVAAYAAVSDMAGSILWYNSGTNSLAALRIKDVFDDFDGLSRTDRLRYDTPDFHGFSVAGSISSGEAYDAALLYSRKFGDTKVAAALAFADPGDLKTGVDAIYSGSASVLLPMGLNFTVSLAQQDLDRAGRDNPMNWWGKIGYRTKFYEAAVTSFSFDYGETSDLAADGDTATTWALTAVHDVQDWGTEFYVTLRNYELDRSSADYDDILTFMTGARVKF